jgi:hypothetical protein
LIKGARKLKMGAGRVRIFRQAVEKFLAFLGWVN